MTKTAAQTLRPGTLADASGRRRQAFADTRFAERLATGDATLWQAGGVADERLGWTRLPASMAGRVEEFEQFAEAVAGDGITDVLLLGMGGSSLGAEVFQTVVGGREGKPRLNVLDSTHPAMVKAYLDAFPARTTLFLVSSKSGTTLETLSFFRAFWERTPHGKHFVAITDPDSELARLAEARDFRALFLAPADVGGRFSALSPFGLVPAALIGVDVGALLASAAAMLARAEEATDLGILLAEAVRTGRDKVTFEASPRLAPFLDWLEQLLAESTGKDGTGIVPVFGEPSEVHKGADRLLVRLRFEHEEALAWDEEVLPGAELVWPSVGALGGEMMRWELATAAAAAVLGVDPFDQPDVELAKQFARQAMSGGSEETPLPSVDAGTPGALEQAVSEWLQGATVGDYISIQAFLPASDDVQSTVASLRADLGASGLPTTLGYGPRFLHSTGQLHKGGPDGAFCLQLIDEGTEDVGVPETDFTFRQLIDAQAAGDARALLERGRRVLRVKLGG